MDEIESDEELDLDMADSSQRELALNDYDRKRQPWPLLEGTVIRMSARTLSTELTCPICLDLLTNTMTTMGCLHRFCQDCITTALQKGNKECPTCRAKCGSKRNLRADPNFDELIRKIWPDRKKYEALCAEEAADTEHDAVVFNMDAVVDEDADAPTPPALMDGRRSASPIDDRGTVDSEEDGGRETPTWVHCGDVIEEDLDDEEKRVHLEARTPAEQKRVQAKAAAEAQAALEAKKAEEEAKEKEKEAASKPAEPTPAEASGSEEKKGEEKGEEKKEKKEEANEGEGEKTEEKEKNGEEAMEVDAALDDPNNAPTPPMKDGIAGVPEETEKKDEEKKDEEMEEGEVKDDEEEEEKKEEKTEDKPKEEEKSPKDEPADPKAKTPAAVSQNESEASTAPSTASDESEDEEEFETKVSVGDYGVDMDEIEELDLMEEDMLEITTWAVDGQPSGSMANGTGTFSAFPTSRQAAAALSSPTKPFNPLSIDRPPFPEAVEQYAELLPNGKGGTWLKNDDVFLQLESINVDDDEEVVYDEDDLLSEADINDLLHEHEDDIIVAPSRKRLRPQNGETNSEEAKSKGAEDDDDTDGEEELPPQEEDEEDERRLKKGDKLKEYLCEETREDLAQINALRLGAYDEVMHALDEGEEFDMGDKVNWYVQHRNGEELVFYENVKMPVPRGKKRDQPEMDEEEENAAIKRRLTLKAIVEGMSETDASSEGTFTSSLASSERSSVLSLSDNEEEVDETAEKRSGDGKEGDCLTPEGVGPPQSKESSKDRLHKWLVESSPSSPRSLDDDHLERKFTHDEDEDRDLPQDNYEIEAELRPALALRLRQVPPELQMVRFLRAHNSTTMEHLSEYLHRRWTEEASARMAAEGKSEGAPAIPVPNHFYVYNQQGQHCNWMQPREPLAIAQQFSSRESHVCIYFDTERAALSSAEKSLLEKIIPSPERAKKQASDVSEPAAVRSSESASSKNTDEMAD